MGKIIMHIDLNAFFVSAELLRHKELIGLPLAVGGDNRRGVISTASYEARNYGVKSGMPHSLAKSLCPKLIILPPDFKYYKELSHKFFSFIRDNYSPIMEIVSIDECYVDMTSVLIDVKDIRSYLKDMQNRLKKELGLGCSIGIARTKFLAKMGSDYKKPMGITIIRLKDIATLLYPLPISDFYGIGKKTSEKLRNLGIYTIGDFAKSTDEEVKKELGKSYDLFKDWINGLGSDEIVLEDSDPKSISSSATFLYDTVDYEEIMASLKEQAKDIEKSLKKNEMIALTIHITLRDSEFHTITRSKTLSYPIEKKEDILAKGQDLLEANWNKTPLRLVGLCVSSLHKKENFMVQLSLFDYQYLDEFNTRNLIKDINKKLNKDLLMTGKDYLKKKGENNGTN